MRKIVKNNWLVTTREQLRHHHTSNVASTAGYEYSFRHASVGLSVVADQIRRVRAGVRLIAARIIVIARRGAQRYVLLNKSTASQRKFENQELLRCRKH